MYDQSERKLGSKPVTTTLQTKCCIVGGGPAGMMLGFLLARAGVEIVVLEKHADFLRDFRGDTIHPSTLELMHELGFLEEFLKRPHQEVRELAAQVGNEMLKIGDFTHLPTMCKFLALMPQWDFLNFIAEKGKCYPGFQVRMLAEATDLIELNGRIVGVTAKTSQGAMEIRAALYRRSRRPPFNRARPRRFASGRFGRSHGCAVDEAQPPPC
jgi:2-polyprenyl-6-methoxyphenol hydroxylase-like FAD-dependent oxidoreductase